MTHDDRQGVLPRLRKASRWCRDTCEAWAEHERRKAERYARKDLERRGTYLIGTSPGVRRWEKERTKSARRKGGAF